MELGTKRCPKCGSTKLLAKKITGVQVESLENGEYKINAEGKTYQIEIAGCAKCKAEFDESQLVAMIPCNKCGKLTEPSDLDANGECDVCRALAERPDLVNMSKEDVIRMMLKLEKSTANNTVVIPSNTSTSPILPETGQKTDISSVAEEKMKAAQAAIDNASNEFSQEIIKETEQEVQETQEKVNEFLETMNPPEEPTSEESAESEKPRRGRKPRKKTDDENADTNEVTENQIEQSANEMSELQEAPFPEQDSEMKQMFDEAVSHAPVQESISEPVPEQTSSPFQMFDDEQSF